VGTILRLVTAHADRWLPVRGSHAVPVYGFERFADPPPLEIDVARLLDSYVRARVTLADTWRLIVHPTRSEALLNLADEAAAALDEAGRADTPSGIDDVAFHLPDGLWASLLYDLAIAVRDGVAEVERVVAALVPIYFARVASLVIEAREMTTQQAEALFERQARAFELAKPEFVQRWEATPPDGRESAA
jgi:hypothetical protein